jgi:uncharacterized spore protein YtfJ
MMPSVPETAEQIELTAGARLLRITETAAHALGARLCFGEPTRHGSRTVIPVASVLTAGGLGFGRSPAAEVAQDGGGGGGVLAARPVGFIELNDNGARFRPIVVTADALQVLGAATVCLVAARAWRRGRH